MTRNRSPRCRGLHRSSRPRHPLRSRPPHSADPSGSRHHLRGRARWGRPGSGPSRSTSCSHPPCPSRPIHASTRRRRSCSRCRPRLRPSRIPPRTWRRCCHASIPCRRSWARAPRRSSPSRCPSPETAAVASRRQPATPPAWPCRACLGRVSSWIDPQRRVARLAIVIDHTTARVTVLAAAHRASCRSHRASRRRRPPASRCSTPPRGAGPGRSDSGAARPPGRPRGLPGA